MSQSEGSPQAPGLGLREQLALKNILYGMAFDMRQVQRDIPAMVNKAASEILALLPRGEASEPSNQEEVETLDRLLTYLADEVDYEINDHLNAALLAQQTWKEIRPLLEGQQGSKTPNPKKDIEGGDAPGNTVPPSAGEAPLPPFGEALELLQVALRNLSLQWCKDGDCLDCRIRRFVNAHKAEGPRLAEPIPNSTDPHQGDAVT